jgi:hypothetical protein
MLLRNGRCVGIWYAEEGCYRAWHGGDSWGDKIGEAPVQVPAHVIAMKAKIIEKKAEPDVFGQSAPKDFGVNWPKISKDSKITLPSGEEISVERAIQMIEQNKIPDDSKKFRLVIIGSDVDRKRVTDAWPTVEANLRDRFALWSVPPDHWSLKDLVSGELLYKVGGTPTIYCQAPDGKVLHRQDEFVGMPDFEAVRKAVKGYDASKDPDLRKPDPKKVDPKKPVEPNETPTSPMPLVLIGGGIVAAYLLKNRGKQ